LKRKQILSPFSGKTSPIQQVKPDSCSDIYFEDDLLEISGPIFSK